jgi:hypothetical protein
VSAMQPCTIRLCDANHPHACPVCGRQHIRNAQGPGLFLEAHASPLCRGCGKKLDPAMAALLELATAAERVGRRSRHMLTPPLESLLDLARAAENYSDSAPCLQTRAG